MKHIYLSLIISVFICSGLQAQTESEDQKEIRSSFRAISLVTGYYNPSLDYYNNRTGFQFTGSLYFTAYAEYWMYDLPLTFRLGAGYYSTNAKIEGDLNWTEELTLNYIPVNLDVLWRFNEIYSYAGAGIGMNFITASYKGPQTNQDPTGYSPHLQGIVGFEYPMSKHFSIGAEFQYILGSYTQEFQSGTSLSEETIDLNGPKIGLKLSYLF
jgi:opacity protein-like surface antigen